MQHTTFDMWHVTCDRWHVTCGTLYVPDDTWQVTGERRWTFSHNFSSSGLGVRDDIWHLTPDTQGWWTFVSNFHVPSSYGLGVKVFRRLGGKGWPTGWNNELLNYECVCRTAPATPGLLNTFHWIGLLGQFSHRVVMSRCHTTFHVLPWPLL